MPVIITEAKGGFVYCKNNKIWASESNVVLNQ